MQNDPFNELLQQHADAYRLSPDASSFERVVQKRARRRRRRLLYFFIPAAAVLVAGSGLLLLLHDAPSPQAAVTTPTEVRIAEQADVYTGRKPGVIDAQTEAPIHTGKEKGRTSAVNDHPGEIMQPDVIHIPASSSVTAPAASLLAAGSDKTTQAAARTRVPKQEQPAPKEQLALRLHQDQPVRPAQEEPKPQAEMQVTQESQTVPQEQLGGNKPVADSEAKAADTVTAPLPPVTSDSTAVAKEQNLIPPPPIHNAAPVSHPDRWSIAAYFTPQLVSSVYSANSDANLSWFKQYYDNKRINDQARFSYNAGMRAERTLSRHVVAGAGLNVSVTRFQELEIMKQAVVTEKFDTLYMPNSMTVTKSINSRVKEYDRNRFDISFTSLELPVTIGYRVSHQRLSCQLNAGVSYSYLLATRSLVFVPSDTLNARETNDAGNARLQRHQVMLLAGMNIGIDITKRWTLYTGPVFRYSMTSLYSKDYVLRQNPYYLGLETGLKFSF